ncbi:Immunoglobulin Superfamily Dcc Subclass Member 4 [Manis pentadactyla]|nr:Immunoglobulin Superfamily Dcc Subclass Member 4 [Manis pentadactyla]
MAGLWLQLAFLDRSPDMGAFEFFGGFSVASRSRCLKGAGQKGTGGQESQEGFAECFQRLDFRDLAGGSQGGRQKASVRLVSQAEAEGEQWVGAWALHQALPPRGHGLTVHAQGLLSPEAQGWESCVHHAGPRQRPPADEQACPALGADLLSALRPGALPTLCDVR